MKVARNPAFAKWWRAEEPPGEPVLLDLERIARTRPGSAARDDLVNQVAARLGVAPCVVWCRYADARAAGEVTRYTWPAGGGEPVKAARSDPPYARAHARGTDPGGYDPFASDQSFAEWKAGAEAGQGADPHHGRSWSCGLDGGDVVPHGATRNRETSWSCGE